LKVRVEWKSSRGGGLRRMFFTIVVAKGAYHLPFVMDSWLHEEEGYGVKIIDSALRKRSRRIHQGVSGSRIYVEDTIERGKLLRAVTKYMIEHYAIRQRGGKFDMKIELKN